MLALQDEWDAKVSSHSASLVNKQQQRIKTLESTVEEQAITIKNLEQQLRRSLGERDKLTTRLADTDHRKDEGATDNENFILRREMDHLLKEKIHLSSENSDLKRKLNLLDENVISGFMEDRSQSLNKSNPNKEKSGIKDKESFLSKNITEEELELRTKVISYFSKRYPKVTVTQINRSRRLLSSYFPGEHTENEFQRKRWHPISQNWSWLSTN